MKYDGSLLFTMFVNTVKVVYTTKLFLECELDFSLKNVSPRRSHAYRFTFQYDYFHSTFCEGVVYILTYHSTTSGNFTKTFEMVRFLATYYTVLRHVSEVIVFVCTEKYSKFVFGI